jgi:hypothetical protein
LKYSLENRRSSLVKLGGLFASLSILIGVWFWTRPNEPAALPDDTAGAVTQVDFDIDPKNEIRMIQDMLTSFLLAVKAPYRPPLGDNRDIVKALTGGNRRGDVFLATNHPSINPEGLWVDRWGTPYHFHPRAPDAIDVRSAGPDGILFTGDDVLSLARGEIKP